MNTRNLTRIGLMTAIICIAAPVSIPLPISPVPVTLGTFALYLSLYILEHKQAITATMIYLLLGAVGVPVFSGYTAGLSKFTGAGGGYLIGYIFLVVIGGYFVNKYYNSPFMQILGCLLATLVTYTIGTFWLSKILNTSFIDTIPAGILVYLPADIVKIFLANILGRQIKSRIK